MKHYDLIVVGTGAANTVTETAAKAGKKVALVEYGKFGGTCLTRGCIPTKVIITAADTVRETEFWDKIGIRGERPTMDWEKVSQRVWDKINDSRLLQQHYESSENVDVYLGKARFIDKKVICVDYNEGGSEEITAPQIVLGVGARTRIQEIEGLNEAGFLTSESFFGEKYPYSLPKSIIIMGGGPIGTEFAHGLATAGVDVTLVQHNVRLLPREEECVSAKLLENVRAAGIQVHLNMKPQRVTLEDGIKCAEFRERSTGEMIEVRAEEILLATGIVPNTDILGLENTDVSTNERGYIITNEFLETSAEGIYALGDVNGKAPFRHKANYEADILAHNLIEESNPENWRWARYDRVPAVTYTFPQAAHVGLTENDAQAAGYEVRTAYHYYSQVSKGYAMGIEPDSPEDGFIKIVAEKDSDRLLGVHIIGMQASILLQPFINLMNAGPTELKPVEEEIASPTVRKLREQKIVREMDPNSIITIGETMTPHPSLSELAMWTRYYYEGKE